MNVAKLLLLLPPLLLMIRVQSSPPHYTISLTKNYANDLIYIPPKEYFQVTLPLPTDHATPACSVNVLTYTFGESPTSPPSSPPTSAPPTISPPSSAPPTISPPMSSPPTSTPPTSAPPTISPPSSAPPPSSSPPTSAPPTGAPPTISPPTSTPPTSAPPTISPPSSSPPTSAPPTSAPPTISPPTGTPPTSEPPTISPPSSAPPPSSSPPTSTPPTSAPPTISPPTSTPPTSAPPTISPPSSSPPTSAPPTSAPPTISPPTSIPPTSEPPTISPPSSAPPPSSPPTSSPPTSAPPTSAPPTISPPTSTPPTSPPPTISPPSSAPPTSSPPMSHPPTSTPPTSNPPTISPPSGAPPTSSPPTSSPPASSAPTSHPPTSSPPSSPPTSTPPTSSPPSNPPTSTPPMSSPPTSIPPTSTPPTISPPTSTPPMSSPPTSSPPITSPPLSSRRISAPIISPRRSSRLFSDSCSCGNTSDSPSISVIYSPPPVTCEWSHAVLEYQVEYKGEQFESIAGIWVGGVELLRTSTAQPTEDGCLWNVRKDVSRYSSILTQENLTLSVILENLGNKEFTGVYQVNVSFLFYSDDALRLPSSVVSGESEALSLNRKLMSVKSQNADNLELDRVIQSLYPYDTPADLIVPISDEGHWFKIQNEFDMPTTNVQISPKTYKAVLELYVSFHDNDEFWYMNPPDSYIQTNHLTTGKGHGAYREVLVTIDGKLVGTVIPFPVIFPSGINPLFWSPVVSIGAFDLPSYDIDLTPYLGLLLGNMNHSIGIQVADGLSFWLVDANLHLWSGDSNVQAIVKYKEPSMEIEREYEFEGLEGEFETEVERSSKGDGWVQSSTGLVKTKVSQEINFKNKLKFKDGGKTKHLEQKIKTKTKIKIKNQKGDTTAKIEIEQLYPLTISIKTEPVFGDDIYVISTTVLQERSESFSDKKAKIKNALNHKQNCTGSMLVKGGSSVIEGSVENHQMYDYKDGFGCYSRKVDAVDGDVVADNTDLICPH